METIFFYILMENKHRKLFIIRHSEKHILLFLSTVRQNTLGGPALPDTLAVIGKEKGEVGVRKHKEGEGREREKERKKKTRENGKERKVKNVHY